MCDTPAAASEPHDADHDEPDHDDTAARAGQRAEPVVRTAEARDHPAILDLWDAAGMLSYVADPGGDLARTADADPELVLVAEHAGAPPPDGHEAGSSGAGEHPVVGTVLGTWDGRRGWIMRLAVAPALRRSGVGKALVAELERRLRGRGADQINLLVFADNRGALSFWQELGYRATAPVVLMTRRVEACGEE